jgi:hypothetical protein
MFIRQKRVSRAGGLGWRAQHGLERIRDDGEGNCASR